MEKTRIFVGMMCSVAVACGCAAMNRPAPKTPAENRGAPAKSVHAAKSVGAAKPVGAPKPAAPADKTVRRKAPEQVTTLAELVASIADANLGNLVVMNGVQDRVVPVPPRKGKFLDMVQTIAGACGFPYQECDHYYFLYQPGYEVLQGLTLAGKLDPAYQSMKLPLALGFDTPIFAAAALIGRALNITVVADDIVAGAKSGPIACADISLQDALEALLKSALMRPDAFSVESTPDYILFVARQNASKSPALLNDAEMTPEQNAMLDARVDVSLPAPADEAGNLQLPYGARPLAQMLGVLSGQLKVQVQCEPALNSLPVNPCVMSHVPVRVAMDLIIRQWPVDRYGYVVQGQTIMVKAKG